MTADEELRLQIRKARYGQGRHARLIGLIVTIDGVRTSYDGTLESVEECGGGVAILHMGENTVALEALCDLTNAVELGACEVYSHAVLAVKKSKLR